MTGTLRRVKCQEVLRQSEKKTRIHSQMLLVFGCDQKVKVVEFPSDTDVVLVTTVLLLIVIRFSDCIVQTARWSCTVLSVN